MTSVLLTYYHAPNTDPMPIRSARVQQNVIELTVYDPTDDTEKLVITSRNMLRTLWHSIVRHCIRYADADNALQDFVGGELYNDPIQPGIVTLKARPKP